MEIYIRVSADDGFACGVALYIFRHIINFLQLLREIHAVRQKTNNAPARAENPLLIIISWQLNNVKKTQKKGVANSVVKENQQERKAIHHFSYGDDIYI